MTVLESESKVNAVSPVSRADAMALVIIVVAWLVSRLGLALVYTPSLDMDSPTYMELAGQLQSLNFSDYNGQRTPMYPLLLLVGRDIHVIWVLQSCMSLMTAILIFFTVKSSADARRLAVGASIAYLSLLNVLFLEGAILTETASAFLVTLACYLFLAARRRGVTIWSAVGIGLVVAALALTRPQYVFMVPLLVILLWLNSSRHRGVYAFVFLLAAAIPIGGWMSFNKQHIGHFTLTSLLGFNLTNHTGAFMEKASDEDALLRDIYLKHRDRKIRQTGSHEMTIFWARDELKQASGLGEVELSTRFLRISKQLITDHPFLYLGGVAKAWASFWAVPGYWELRDINSAGAFEGFRMVWKIEHPTMRLLNVIFLLCSGLLFWSVVRNPTSIPEQLVAPSFMAVVVLSTSVVQALAEYGENPRYYIPSQPLVIMVTALAIPSLWHIFKQRQANRKFAG